MNGSLNFLKFFAVMVVTLFHAYSGIGFFRTGFLFVDLLFMVSGYFMAESLCHKRITFKDFAVKRFLRLYPVFLVANASIWMVRFGNGESSEAAHILASLFFVSYSPLPFPPSLIGWFCPALFYACITLYPLVVMPKSDKVKMGLFMLIALLFYTFIWVTTKTLGKVEYLYGGWVMKGYLRGIAGVALGIFISYGARAVKSFNYSLMQALEFLSMLGIAGLLLVKPSLFNQVLFVCASCGLLLVCSQNVTFAVKALNNKASVFLGKLSLSIYLSHTTLLYVLKHYYCCFKGIETIGVYVVLVMATGILWYYVFEKGSDRLLQKFRAGVTCCHI